MKTAFLFPGQGAQAPGMAKDLWEASPAVKRLFETASSIAGKDMAALIFDGSEDDLKSTDNTQIAMTLANAAAATVLGELGVEADFCAGFSVGEYAALHQAGVLDAEDLFKAVLLRGRVMEKASRLHDKPEGNAGMSAVLGLPFEEAAPIVRGLESKQVYIANHSSPTQIVIAGSAAGLEAAEAALDKAGAMKVVRLKVSGPFHSPMLASARAEFEAGAAAWNWRDPKKPIVSNVTGAFVKTGAEARALAGEQIVSTVRWVDSMGLLRDQGAARILEVGPGRVLGGLWKAFTKDSKCLSAGTLDAIKEAVAAQNQ